MSNAGKSIRVLNASQKWALGRWLEANSSKDSYKNMGYERLAQIASETLKFQISSFSVATMAKAVGLHEHYRMHEGRNRIGKNQHNDDYWKNFTKLTYSLAESVFEIEKVLGTLASEELKSNVSMAKHYWNSMWADFDAKQHNNDEAP